MNIDRFKYRIWDKYLREMSYISLDEIAGDTYFWFDGKTEQEYVFNDCLNERQRFNIGQCTGLKDKYNTFIYEGDIVNIYAERYSYAKEIKNALVMYNEQGVILEICDDTGDVHFFSDYEPSVEIEIIGNIFENSDLVVNSQKEWWNQRYEK